jgi:hypothetical protein
MDQHNFPNPTTMTIVATLKEEYNVKEVFETGGDPHSPPHIMY